MADKNELLQSLKIDRNVTAAPTGMAGWKVLLVVAVCVAIAIWLTLTFAVTAPPQTATAPPAERPEVVSSAPANSQPETATPAASDVILNSSGYITARRMATVSAEIMGLITEVKVEEGMRVEQGQILATLDATLAQTNYDYAMAQIDVLTARKSSIEANLVDAQENHQRVFKNTYSSAAEKSRALALMRSLSANLESAEADLRVAQIEIRRQRERLADHTIRAPFTGVVTVKAAQPGEIVSPSSAGGGFTRTGICTIVDMDSLEIEVDVNESFIGRVYPQQPVEAELDAYPNWKIPASVIAIIPTADRAKATVQVRIKIEQPDPRILPDMGVKVAFKK